MQDSLFQQGIDLMIFGMGTVFLFLTLLVVSVVLMSTVMTKYFAESPAPVLQQTHNSPADKTSRLNSGSVDPHTLRIIQDAIHQHRAKNPP